MNFQAILELLARSGVRFVVVGAFAGVAHGSAAVTRDLDICYERTEQNYKALAKALTEIHARLRGAPKGLPFVADEKTLANGMNFTFETDLGDLDLMGEISGLGHFPGVERGAVRVSLYGREFLVLSLDALIKSKRAAGRPKDLIAVAELEAIRELDQ